MSKLEGKPHRGQVGGSILVDLKSIWKPYGYWFGSKSVTEILLCPRQGGCSEGQLPGAALRVAQCQGAAEASLAVA